MVYIVSISFIVLDLITGLIKAFKEKAYTSTVMRQGLFHKSASLLCIGFGALVEWAQGFLDIGVTIPIASGICIYIVLMEIGSIIENICAINPNIMGSKLRSFFAKLDRKDD